MWSLSCVPEWVVCLCGTSPVKAEYLKGLLVHLNCAEFEGTFRSLCVLLFSLDFVFFFCLAIFCRQLHFVLIMGLPDAMLNSTLLSLVQTIYSTVVWFPCLASGRICFFNYKVNFLLWTQFRQLTVTLIYPPVPMTGFPCKQKLHLSSGTNFYEYISWNVGYFYKVCKWKWKILRGCPGMWRAYISVWTWVSKPVLAFNNGWFVWLRASFLANW